MPREVVDPCVPSLETFRARLDMALGNLGWWSGLVGNPAHSRGGVLKLDDF